MAQRKFILSSEEQHHRMLHTPIPRLVTALALPTVITQTISIVYNTADAYFVSKISNSASAAVGVAFSLMSLIHAFGAGVGMGCGSLLSIKLGAKKNEEADRIASCGCILALGLGALVAILGLLFTEPLMLLFGSTRDMLPHTCPYARYLLLAAPALCLSFTMLGIMRAEGETKLSMAATVSGALLNIVLDPILIFRWGMGTAGAGLATALSQLFTLLIVLAFFASRKSIVKPSFRKLSRTAGDYLEIVKVGIPTTFRQGLATLASALLTRSAAQVSVTPEEAIAAVTISNKVYLMVRNIILGLGQGFQPVAGYNYGAGNMKRTRQAFWFTTAAGTVLCCAAAGAIALFPYQVISFFRDDPIIVRIGSRALLYACAVMPFMAFSTYVNQLYQCLGFKVEATILASCRQGICFLPLIFTLPRFFAIEGVSMTQPGADLLTFLVSVPFIVFFFRRRVNVSINGTAGGDNGANGNGVGPAFGDTDV